jgi:hypothetical protein
MHSGIRTLTRYAGGRDAGESAPPLRRVRISINAQTMKQSPSQFQAHLFIKRRVSIDIARMGLVRTPTSSKNLRHCVHSWNHRFLQLTDSRTFPSLSPSSASDRLIRNLPFRLTQSPRVDRHEGDGVTDYQSKEITLLIQPCAAHS